jgi:hypothetical protein
MEASRTIPATAKERPCTVVFVPIGEGKQSVDKLSLLQRNL